MDDEARQLFFRQVERDVAGNPMQSLLVRYFRSKQEAVFQLKEQSADDAAILAFISDAFGICGGGSLQPEGWYEYAGGKHPALEIQDGEFRTTHRLEGRELVNAFRTVFRITNGQLRLL